jgi:hypothetical protein
MYHELCSSRSCWAPACTRPPRRPPAGSRRAAFTGDKWVAYRRTTVKSRPAGSTVAGADDKRVSTLLRALKADPELAAVVHAFEERANAEGAPGRKFGSRGLKVNGKLFALFTQGTLVVKLPKDRVAELIASKFGEAFDPGHGRLMKEWLTVTSPKAPWTDLAKEAYGFVKSSSR